MDFMCLRRRVFIGPHPYQEQGLSAYYLSFYLLYLMKEGAENR